MKTCRPTKKPQNEGTFGQSIPVRILSPPPPSSSPLLLTPPFLRFLLLHFPFFHNPPPPHCCSGRNIKRVQPSQVNEGTKKSTQSFSSYLPSTSHILTGTSALLGTEKYPHPLLLLCPPPSCCYHFCNSAVQCNY